jgi:hypothetical protein
VDGDLRRRRFGVVAAIALVGILVACSPGGGGTDRDLLHDRGAAADALTQIQRAVGTAPAQAREVTVYPAYAIAEAQDPKNREHIDEYTWRDGRVQDPKPVQLNGPQAEVVNELFPTSAVRWRDVPHFVRVAEHELERAQPTRVEQARGSYVIVRRTSGDGDAVVTLSVYAQGPRRSGYAELTTTGEVVGVHVS